MKLSEKLSIGELVQFACMLEVTVRKPGNVHRFASFHDLNYLDFLHSAGAVAQPMNDAPRLGLGRTVLECIRLTREVVSTNTNLGIVLLCAPFAVAGLKEDLREQVKQVLSTLSKDDAVQVYEAIRLAKAGGLGHVPQQDVASAPSIGLRDAMALAADRDMIARQYANGFEEVFEFTLPVFERALSSGLRFEESIVELHLRLMAEFPDSLIARKSGKEVADRSSEMAASVLEAGWPKTEKGRLRLCELDTWLRDPAHRKNPGTTADFVTVTLFIAAARDIFGPEDLRGFQVQEGPWNE